MTTIWQDMDDDERYDALYCHAVTGGRPEFIVCNATFYEEFRRAVGEAIWERELERARRKLGRLRS